MTTITHEELVQKTFDFPQGCEGQKIEFLRTFGIDDPKSLIRANTITVQAQYRRDARWYEGLDGCSYMLRDIGLEPTRLVSGSAGRDVWAVWECEVTDRDLFLKSVGLGVFERTFTEFRIKGDATEVAK